MKPAGSSMKSVIQNNELFFTKSRPGGAGNQSLMKFYKKKEFPLFYDTFEVRNNKLSICEDIIDNPSLISTNGFDNLNLTLIGNNFVDHREKTKFFSSNYSIRNQDKNMNSFNESECSHI